MQVLANGLVRFFEDFNVRKIHIRIKIVIKMKVFLSPESLYYLKDEEKGKLRSHFVCPFNCLYVNLKSIHLFMLELILIQHDRLVTSQKRRHRILYHIGELRTDHKRCEENRNVVLFCKRIFNQWKQNSHLECFLIELTQEKHTP